MARNSSPSNINSKRAESPISFCWPAGFARGFWELASCVPPTKESDDDDGIYRSFVCTFVSSFIRAFVRSLLRFARSFFRPFVRMPLPLRWLQSATRARRIEFFCARTKPGLRSIRRKCNAEAPAVHSSRRRRLSARTLSAPRRAVSKFRLVIVPVGTERLLPRQAIDLRSTDSMEFSPPSRSGNSSTHSSSCIGWPENYHARNGTTDVPLRRIYCGPSSYLTNCFW